MRVSFIWNTTMQRNGLSGSKDAPSKARTTIISHKFMPTIIWGVTGFSAVVLTTTQKTFNSEYFAEQTMTPLVDKIYPEEETRMLLESKFTTTVVAPTF
jgi:hypothetical protein